MKKQQTEVSTLFLSPEQAAKVSGIGENRLRQLMEERKIKYVCIGNRRLTTIDALMDFFEREKVRCA